jgi:hypothetical protein
MAENEDKEVYSDIEEDISGTKLETKMKSTTLSKEIALSKQLISNLKTSFKYDKSNYESY